MRNHAILVSLCSLFLVGAPGHGATEPADPFLKWCASATRDVEENNACSAYIAGWMGAYAVLSSAPESAGMLCVPPGGFSGEMGLAIVHDWMRKEHPEVKSMKLAVLLALADHYPCAEKGKEHK